MTGQLRDQEADATLKRVIAERDKLAAQVTTLETRCDSLRQERADAIDIIDELNERVEQERLHSETCRLDAEQAKATVQRQAREILTAADELAKAERDRDAARDEADGYMRERDEERNELEQAKAQVQQQADAFMSLNAELEAAVRDRDIAEKGCENLAASAKAERTAHAAVLAADIEQARKQVARTKAELEKLAGRQA